MLSTRSEYGLRLIIALAKNKEENKPIPLSLISAEEGISDRYLQKISQILVKSGFIKAVRGLKGGFVLLKSPTEINLYELITVLEGISLTPTCTQDKAVCTKTASCLAKNIWLEASAELRKSWSKITIQNLLDKGEIKDG